MLYAPEKSFVYLLGEWNDFKAGEEGYMNRTPDGLRWWLDVSGLEAGREYTYQYLVDGSLKIADPYSTLILDPFQDQFIPDASYPDLRDYPQEASGVVSVFNTRPVDYEWNTDDFKGVNQEELIIYELLIRDFVDARNYQSLTDTLDRYA